MQDKLGKICVVVFVFVLLNICSVLGYTGKGTNANPYVVSSESDLRTVLVTLAPREGWTYVAINSDITLTNSINIDGGKYRIYANGANRTIKRSGSTGATINESGNPKYCMRIIGSSQVVIGYGATNYQLKLGGNKNAFSNSFPSSGWFTVEFGSTLILDVNSLLTNAINNENLDNSSVIRCAGDLHVKGEISNCEGVNGGAIKSWGGYIKIFPTAKIHNCISRSEGGAIYINQIGYLEMTGGKIYQCQSEEEGGGIFLGEGSLGEIFAGDIYSNYSKKSAGGIFSGYGTELYIGKNDGSGPNIYNNQALGSGGGIRCNGGITETAGGVSYFLGGQIYNNISGNLGGGISCGAAGKKGVSKISITNISVHNNVSTSSGGGIWLPENATGINTTYVPITNVTITSNKSSDNGGGILVNCSVSATNVCIDYNSAVGNGGGVSITETAVFHYKGNLISGNTSGNKGQGVYVKGQFIISDKGQVNSSNDVFLTKDTYIEVQSIISGNSFLNAVIKSAVTTTGTKLVKVNYGNKNSAAELYYEGTAAGEYNGEAFKKRYSCNNIASTQLLRAGTNISGYGEWIFISEEYALTYNKNTEEPVSNMPNKQKKYWNEIIYLSNKNLIRNNFITDETKHWNTSANGRGAVFLPGGAYNINGNNTLYAQWIQIAPNELIIDTTDRYYVVGQNISLTKEELLKKVKVTDDLESGATYATTITYIKEYNKDVLVQADNIQPQKYIDTSLEKHYVIGFIASDSEGKLKEESMINVYILDGELQNDSVRFISLEYMYTLSTGSKWKGRLNDVLMTSLNSNSGTIITLDRNRILDIKNKIKSNDYNISREMNIELMELW